MQHTLPCALIMLALLVTLGCRKAQEPPPVADSPHKALVGDREETKSLAEPSAPEPLPSGLSADDLQNLLMEQRARLEQTNRELAAARDPQAVREILLRRKGEILKVQKTIRQSDQMTPAQKDSLLLPLEQESVRISTRLMNTPR